MCFFFIKPMMKYVLLISLIFGFNFTLWGLLGLLRLIWETVTKIFHTNGNNKPTKYRIKDVCTITAAFNEEKTIQKTINSLTKIIPIKQVYVINDGSKDKTEEILKKSGCKYLSIQNRGKAPALATLIKHFQLTDRYDLMIIIDADSVISEDYFKYALPFFNDPKVAAVACFAQTQWDNATRITAHRQKMYRLLQSVFKFGQSWKPFNAINIIPGFCSIYRTSVVKKIKIDAPGLVIEDYNMTFEVQHQKLGHIAHHPKVRGFTQDPADLKNYVKQIRRWNLGLWQTIRRHGFWPSKFWLALGIYLFENLSSSIFLLISPLLLIVSILILIAGESMNYSGEIMLFARWYILSFIIAYTIDYLMTIAVAIVERKPKLAWWELRAFWLKYIDAWMILRTIPLAFTEKSNGTWIPPTRR